MDTTSHNLPLPTVQIAGTVNHPDFLDAISLLRDTAQIGFDSKTPPEIIIVAQTRPSQVARREIESLQRRWPLAPMVAIVGSWCEGELRTGRPWPGVRRFYWYEFPIWWRQQITLRRTGRCPEWARPVVDSYRSPPIRNPKRVYPPRRAIRNRPRGLIHLGTADRSTAGALADVLNHAGYATVWNPIGQPTSIVRGAAAGIWNGGQLDEREVRDLANFCRLLSRDAAPVLALLDFPRADRVDVARQLGATVLGKPWINADLIGMIDDIAGYDTNPEALGGRAA